MAYEPGNGAAPSEVHAFLLDAGGVFILPNPVVVASALSGSITLNLEGYDDRPHYVATAGLDALIAVGADWGSPRSGYLGHFCAALGVAEERLEDSVHALRRQADLWSRILPGSVEGLHSLLDAGYPVAVVSNSDGRVERQLLEGGVCQVGSGQLASVTAVLDSTVVGVSKPDPRIFGLGAAAVGRQPSSCVFVGDTVHYDIAGAWGAGMWPVHFDPYRTCPHRRAHDHVQSLDDLTAFWS
jgi:HAD superfamily hydrolase (TIGR01509 family)